MTASTTSVIYETSKIQILYRKGSSEYLLVTFNEMTSKANGADFWGKKLCDAENISAIGVMSKSPNWFPEKDISEALPHISPILSEYSEKILYGHSQGGYAAIKYSKAFNSTTSISFCPQYSIDPLLGDKSDPRFTRFFKNEDNQGMEIKREDIGSGNIFILHDPFHDLEDRNFRLISTLSGNIFPVYVPFTGHETVRIFAGRKIASTLINSLRKNQPSEIVRAIPAVRKPWKSRIRYVALAALKRHPAWAARIISLNMDSLPEIEQHRMHAGIIRFWDQCGRYDLALAASEDALRFDASASAYLKMRDKYRALSKTAGSQG